MGNRVLAIIALILLLASAVSPQEPPPASPHVSWARFGGIVDVDPNSSPVGQALDIMNYDILQTGDALAISRRPGFARLGQRFSSENINGLYQYASADGNRALVAIVGRAIYEYDAARDTFTQAASYNVAGSCAVTSGSDTIRGIGTSWWGLSNYQIDSIRIQDTDSTRSVEIRHILSDTIMVVAWGWLGATNSARACTLLAPATVAVAYQFSEGTETSGNMLLDTLVIAGAAERVRYASRGTSLAGVTTLDSVGSTLSYQHMSGRGLVGLVKLYGFDWGSDAVSPYWFQICKNGGSGTNQWRNIALRSVTGGPGQGWMAADTSTFLFLTEGPGGLKYRRLTESQAACDTLFRCTITTVAKQVHYADAIAPIACGGVDSCIYAITYTVLETSVANQPSGWPVDSLVDMTVVPRTGAKAASSSLYDVPVHLIDTAGGTAIKFTIYTGSTGVDPGYFSGTDSLVLLSDRHGTESLSASDSIQVDTGWAWPVQFMFTPERLGYFGNTGDYGPSYIMVMKGLEIVRDSVDQYVGVAVDDGRPILGAINIGSYVYVHKGGQEVYQIELSEIGKAGVITTTNTGTSAVSQKGVGQWRGVMVFVSPTGLYAGVGSSAANLSGDIMSYWTDSIPDGRMGDVRLQISGDVAYVSYPSTVFGGNDRTLVFDFLSRQWTKYSLGFGASAILENPSSEDTLVFGSPVGSSVGNVCLFGRGVSDTGVVSDCYYRTGYFPVDVTHSLYALDRYSLIRWTGGNDTLTLTAWSDYGSGAVATSNSTGSAGWGTVDRYIRGSRLGAVWSFQIGATAATSDSSIVSVLELDFTRKSSRPRR